MRRRSAAERAGVKVGDFVLAINDITTSNLTHQQMLELVSHQQLVVRLTLSRYADIQEPSYVIALGAQRLMVKLYRDRSVGLSVGAYVRRSVCPVNSLFGTIGRTGPGMRQVRAWVWESVHGKGYFEVSGANLGRALLYPMGTLRRTCVTLPQPSELRFWVVRAVGRGIAVLDGGRRRPRGWAGFWGFCSPFSQWEMPLVDDGEVFPIRMRKLHNVSVRRTYLWKSRLVDFWQYIRFQHQRRGL